MSYSAKSGHGYGSIRRARRVQARRSNHAKAIDSQLKAPKAKNTEQWLSAPNRFDLPTVDTNKPQVKTKVKSQRLPFTSAKTNDFTRLIDKDFINNHPETQKAYKQILKKLDIEEIPYTISKEKSIYVSVDNYLKADKLTEKESKIIYENRNFGID